VVTDQAESCSANYDRIGRSKDATLVKASDGPTDVLSSGADTFMRMQRLLDAFDASVRTDTLPQTAHAFGVDARAVHHAFDLIGPLLLDGMARTARRSEGAETLMRLLPDTSPGLFDGMGTLGDLLNSLLGTEPPSGEAALQALMGPGVQAMGASLSQLVGFNVAPLMPMAATTLLGKVAKVAGERGLDATGLSTMLQSEHRAIADVPANAALVACVAEAVARGEAACERIAVYGADWARVIAAPAAAMIMVTTTEMSGPFGTIRETRAASDAMIDAARRAGPRSLLTAAFAGGLTAEMIRRLQAEAPTIDGLIEVIRSAVAAVARHSPEELYAFKATLRAVARSAAAVTRDVELIEEDDDPVNEEEQAALRQIEDALA
jgi:hypothetical protein